MNSRPKRKLTRTQERRRIEGLRLLARIIARHYLANPHLYRNGTGGGKPLVSERDGAATDGEVAGKEGEA